MQFIQHSFSDNFNNAVKSKDVELQKQLICDEIAKLMTFEREKVLSALIKADIIIPARCTDKKLMETIIQNINKPVVKKQLLVLILSDDAGSVNAPKMDAMYEYFNLDGEGTKDMLHKKIQAHRGNKLAMTGEANINTKRIVLKTILWTTVANIAIYFIIKWVVKANKKSETAPMPDATPAPAAPERSADRIYPEEIHQ